MTALRFVSMPTAAARAFQAGAADANGQPPERHVADEDGLPCRHCQRPIATGEPYLILAYRPFPAAQPYAELGPIFLHAEPCERHPDSTELPEMFRDWKSVLVRGYGADDRIVYGTGEVVTPTDVARRRNAFSCAATCATCTCGRRRTTAISCGSNRPVGRESEACPPPTRAVARRVGTLRFPTLHHALRHGSYVPKVQMWPSKSRQEYSRPP